MVKCNLEPVSARILLRLGFEQGVSWVVMVLSSIAVFLFFLIT